MNDKLAKRIVDASNKDLELYENYSGKGMYNKTTSGVVGNIGDFMKALSFAMIDFALEDVNKAEEIALELDSIRLDNMGYSSIVFY